MYEWLRGFIADARRNCDFASSGASMEELAELESRLGIVLPPSYRGFLHRWNGARFCSKKVFAVDEVMEFVDYECGFSAYRDELRLAADSGIECRWIYRLKPTHFLAFGMPDFSSDLYSLDTSRTIEGEHPVCEFAHDSDDVAGMSWVEYPSFEVFLMEQLYGGMGLTDVFLDEELEEEECERYFEEKQELWGERLAEMLTAAGADMKVLRHQRWDDWRRAHAAF